MFFPIQDTIVERTSKRSYDSTDLSEETIDIIKTLLHSTTHGPLGKKSAFRLIQKSSPENKKIKLGTYGFIKGAQNYIVGYTSPVKEAFLDYGFLLEKIILDMTRLQLGTCWLGGTFDRGEFSKSIHLPEGFVIPAVTPVGHASPNRSLGDRVIRLSAGSKKRKPFESLFFHNKPGNPLTANTVGDKVIQILEMIRLAPSASNLQPWRIIYKNERFCFYLQRKPGYQRAFSKVDLQMVDMGISMCHFNLTANEIGMEVSWSIEKGADVIDDWEYIISANI